MCFFKQKKIRLNELGNKFPVYENGYVLFGHYPQSITNNKFEKHKVVKYQYREASLSLDDVIDTYTNEKTGRIEINDSKEKVNKKNNISFSNKIIAKNKKKYLFKYEKIKWKVLFENDEYWLVISDKILDNIQFSNDRDNNNYEDSYIRKWLNEVFIHEAFSKEEQEFLTNCTINLGPESTDIFYTTYNDIHQSSVKNIYKNTNNSGTIEDKVFLLSYQDLISFNFEKSDGNSKERQKYYTDYCISQNINALHQTGDYWTRSKYYPLESVFNVNKDGNVKKYTSMYDGPNVNTIGVVPGLAISKKKNSSAKHIFSYSLPSGVSFSDNKRQILVMNQSITFGNYFQKSNKLKTPLIWELIEETEDYYLLQTRFIIDQMIFDNTKNLFENSLLRKWLNTDFIDEAFSQDEKKFLLPHFNNDKVTIFSQEELRSNKYYFGVLDFGTITRQKIATDYAIKKGLYNPNYIFRMDSGFESWYWTRSSAYQDLYDTKINIKKALIVDENGELIEKNKNILNCGVVPVIKLYKGRKLK
jgi:hypothetical protein